MKNKGFLLSNTSRDLYDEFIYTDSNLLLDVFNDDREGHFPALKFMEDIYSSNSSILVYSDHTLGELRKVLRENISFRMYPSKKGFKRLNILEKQLVMEEVEKDYSKILNIFTPVSEQASYDVVKITEKTKIITGAFENKVHDEDALHLAIMRENGINSIATSDKDLFNHTKGLNVYGDNKSIKHHQNTFSSNELNTFEIFNNYVDEHRKIEIEFQ